MKLLIKQLLREGLFNQKNKQDVDKLNEFVTFACD